MDLLSVEPAQGSPGDQDGSHKGSLASVRRTTHTGKQSGLAYGLAVVLHHLRPFIPFVIISILVVVLIYLLQTIIYGGPFTDPYFFVKFDQRWPRRDPHQVLVVPAEPYSPPPPGRTHG
jgi:hypothetical protein